MVLWDTCFVLALPFHHRDLEPDCRCRSFDEGGGAYARDKNTSARLCAKNAGVGGGAYARGGGGVSAGHYGIISPHQIWKPSIESVQDLRTAEGLGL